MKNWRKTSHPDAEAAGHQKFVNRNDPTQQLRFDRAKPGKTGHRGQDHWHRINPNGKKSGYEYLDENGNPVKKYSPESHLYPN